MKKTWWIKNADNQLPSSSLTLVMITWSVVMLWLLISIFAPLFGLTIWPFNAESAMLVLSPILLNYYGRRVTQSKQNNNPTNTENNEV